MGTIGTLLKAWQRVDTDRAIDDALEDTKGEVLRLNKEQLMYGQSATGGPMPRYRNKAYEAKKRAMNPLNSGRWDLRLTGDFIRQMFIDVRPTVIVIGSADSKAIDLLRRAPQSFGLTPASRIFYVRHLRPVFMNNIKKQLHG